jgi:putative FmdB family regulatory protein
MPIYEFQCKVCGERFEYLVGLGKDEDVLCKNCGSATMERVLSVTSFIGSESERAPGRTCCGREERCETPPCSGTGTCSRR